MNNKEAIKIIEDECEHIKSHLKCKGKAEDFYKELGDMCIAFYMAIKALEQEPCEDAVSRETIMDELNRLGRNAFKDDTDYDNFFAFIDGLLPVTPQEPSGDLISRQAVLDIDFHRIMHTTCGAKMIEPQESEE